MDLPRSGRYKSRDSKHDWFEARRRFEESPGEWVLPLDEPLSSGTIAWLRTKGPIALEGMFQEIEWRLRHTHRQNPPNGTTMGVLYARWTPGQAPAEHRPGNLDPDQAQEMRQQYADGGVTQQQLSEEYGVALASVWNILHGRTYRYAGGPIIEKEN